MRLGLCLWTLLLCLALPVQALELVINGDFEQPLDVGWDQWSAGYGATFSRQVDCDDDMNYEARLRRGTGNGSAMLYQVVGMPSTDLEFSVDLKAYAMATATAWAGAGVIVAYLDGDGFTLGETRICSTSPYCPWDTSPTSHIIPVPNNIWENHAFNLADELTNLPGIDPAEIRWIKLGLIVQTMDC
jgi:hypothetical protein